jgi:putative transposase
MAGAEEVKRSQEETEKSGRRAEGAGERVIAGIGKEMPPVVQKRMAGIQVLLQYEGSREYGRKQQELAEELGISQRSVQRMIKAWREEGLQGLMVRPRRDRGEVRIGEDWQQYIVKTYKEGNRGSCQMSPLQVAVRVKVRAQELGETEYPSHMTVYRLLKPLIEKGHQTKRSIGWKGSRLMLKTREGLEIAVEWSNQVWQCDHTLVDVLVVGQAGEKLGRPWLTTVIDTYSRCIMGLHLGFDAPSAAVVCLALRHAILPKQYGAAYELRQSWGTYGLPQYLYTDGGKDFRSQHLEQVATELGIVLCLRRKPSDGGIVERPFGTLNTQFFSSLPGYVSSNVSERSSKAESEACLTLVQLEQLLVRYIVDHYNQGIDARMGNQSRLGRWEAGRIAQLALLGERELDICLMRRERRTVYRSGYIQFANLVYQGEHLAAYAGESVIIRYNPRDITTIYIYQLQDSKEVFLTRAHAQGWETETLSYKEAQVLSERRQAASKAVDCQSMLSEVRDREEKLKTLQQHQKKRQKAEAQQLPIAFVSPETLLESADAAVIEKDPTAEEPMIEPDVESEKSKKPVPFVRVYDYEELKRQAGVW